jgi:predicted small lipoprotein YifL
MGIAETDPFRPQQTREDSVPHSLERLSRNGSSVRTVVVAAIAAVLAVMTLTGCGSDGPPSGGPGDSPLGPPPSGNDLKTERHVFAALDKYYIYEMFEIKLAKENDGTITGATGTYWAGHRSDSISHWSLAETRQFTAHPVGSPGQDQTLVFTNMDDEDDDPVIGSIQGDELILQDNHYGSNIRFCRVEDALFQQWLSDPEKNFARIGPCDA